MPNWGFLRYLLKFVRSDTGLTYNLNALDLRSSLSDKQALFVFRLLIDQKLKEMSRRPAHEWTPLCH